MTSLDATEWIKAVAGRQYATVATWQAVQGGWDKRLLSCRRWLHRVHEGVYATVPPDGLSIYGRYMAAVLYTGEGAALADRSAAAFWAMAAGQPPWIEVATPRRRAGCQGVQVRGRRSFRAVVVDGIAVTTPAQTILDLAARGTDRQVEKALGVAYDNRLLTPEEHAWLFGPHRGCPGAHRLRRFATAAPTATTTESELEEDFIALLDRFGLPRPDTNPWMTLPDGSAIRIDALWRRYRLAVELDGGTHRTPEKQASDAARDAWLQALGWRALRFTHAQVHRQPTMVREVLRAVMALGA